MRTFDYYLNLTQEIGYVEKTTSSIVYARGLPKAKPEEIILFENQALGQVLSLTQSLTEILVFSENSIRPGTRAVRTNEILEIPVGFELLGTVIDPLGYPIETSELKKTPKEKRSVNSQASGILTRKKIKNPLETGVSIVDLVIPLGQGQKELIIGDRKTGKTNFLLQSISTQAKKGNVCVYAAIGKRKIEIKELKDFFKKHKIADKVVVVASSPQDPPGAIYLTPYSAMTISEYFRDAGKDVLLVLDDLSTHAKFYREISLLAKRFPGRNSYPGDIFYIHAKLLERAGNFITTKGERSITCFPVAQTLQGDLSGYIQTNLMSMTDGHLYFDADLFSKGRRPAINPFLSVTRVGKQTQSPLKRTINREILSFLTLFEKIQNFTHFGAELNEGVKATLKTGDKVITFFQQNPSLTIPINAQIILFAFLWSSIAVRDIDSKDLIEDIDRLIKYYQRNEKTKKEVDRIVDSAKSFNELLGLVNKLGKDFIKNIVKL